jgi:RNA methyltransferase, TrmH family
MSHGAGPRTDRAGGRPPGLALARQLAKRSQRERRKLFLAEGPQAVREALAGRPSPAGLPGLPGLITELFVTTAARARHGEIVDAAMAAKVPVHEIGGELMAELAQTVTPQGLLAVCPFIDLPLADLVAASPRLVVLLANVRDPGNAGTVLRTADAAGADGVIFADASVDPYNSKCVRSSAGSMFHLRIATGVPLAEATTALREAGLAVLAADGSAGLSLDQLGDSRLGRPTAWMFGNEAWGLPSDLLELADEAVAVPIYGRAESLNLAAAAAVCLYASARAHAQGVPHRSCDTLGFGYVAS